MTGIDQASMEQIKDIEANDRNLTKSSELFVSCIGESGSNELIFYNVHDYSVVQKLELS